MSSDTAERTTRRAAGAADDRDCTRSRILDAALVLFADQGYGATSMREIAEQLSITKAALYYHFDSKEDIVRALLAELEAEVEELTSWACSQPPGSQLRRDVLARWSDIMQARGLVLVRFLFANRSVVREVRPERGGMFEQLRALFDHLLSPDAGVEEQLRMRMAFLAVNLAGVAGADIDAPEGEILDAARVLARDILPRAE